MVGLMSACGDHGHSHDQADDQSHDDHGHPHDQPDAGAAEDHGHPHDRPDAGAAEDHGHPHDQPDAGAAEDHGHPHDEAGGHADGERSTVAVTRWTDRSELFMEYPVFVAGESGRSAIHVTDLNDFSPLSEGQAAVVLRDKDGRVLEFRDGASRPGIFGVDLKVDRPGVYEMSLR
ncbi:MAG: hypothetical protein HKP01_05760, partial [Gemmatimonadetes bacterium]|nr:hypothetical protein [Gemmatimonadota bacterium]